jgi:hypothetical protein
MTTIEELSATRNELRSQAEQLDRQLSSVRKQIGEVSRAIDWATYTCSCVRLNKDLNIWNTFLQEDHGRKGLTTGVVEETLSADKNCPICHGLGIPPECK